MLTLNEIASNLGVSLQTVYNRKAEAEQRLGRKIEGQPHPTDKRKVVYDAAAVELITGQPIEPVTAVRPEVMPENFIQGGKLATVEERAIELPPQGFDPAVMVRFFDGVTGQVTDTASLVAIADLALQAVDSAMDEKLIAQREQLNKAEKDAELLSGKISEAKTRLQVKALESKILAESQTKATKSAEQLFGELMALGKPPTPQDGEAG